MRLSQFRSRYNLKQEDSGIVCDTLKPFLDINISLRALVIIKYISI